MSVVNASDPESSEDIEYTKGFNDGHKGKENKATSTDYVNGFEIGREIAKRARTITES